MTLDQVILLEKHKDIIKDRSQVIFAEGVTNASKSFIVGIAYMFRILAEPDEHTQFVLAGESVPVLERMFIQNEASFYNLFRPICTYTSAGQGGARIVVQPGNGKRNKVIYLVGYDNRKRWKSILGLTVYGFNIEEINIADDEFISEAFIRTFRNGGFMYGTSNGGDPDTLVYTDYMNKGRPLDKWSEQIPKETWEELNRSIPDNSFRYYFFTFDDNPTMTQEQLRGLMDNTPKDSYQWKTKILGIRGIREGVIYADYMSRNKNIINLDMLSDNASDMAFLAPRGIELITVGQDVGGTDNNVFTLNVFTHGYREHIVVDMLEFNDVGHDEIWNRFAEWFAPYYEKYSMYMKGVFIDSAAKIMRLTMDDRLNAKFNLRCYNAYKHRIVLRVDSGVSQLEQGQLLFTQKTEKCYESFTKAAYDNSSKTDIRMFPKHEHKDRVDSVEYGQANYTVYMAKKNRYKRQ
jgi:hypothetical protein